MEDTRKNILENFREVYASTIKLITGKQSFKDYAQTDGTVLRIEADMAAIGVPISVVAADGTVVPVADGSYELAVDGKTFNITVESGLITTLEMIAEEAIEPSDEEIVQTNQAMAEDLTPRMVECENRIAVLEEAMNMAKQEAMTSNNELKATIIKLESDKEELRKFAESTLNTFEAFAKMPQVEATSIPKNKIVKMAEMEAWRRKVAGEI